MSREVEPRQQQKIEGRAEVLAAIAWGGGKTDIKQRILVLIERGARTTEDLRPAYAPGSWRHTKALEAVAELKRAGWVSDSGGDGWAVILNAELPDRTGQIEADLGLGQPTLADAMISVRSGTELSCPGQNNCPVPDRTAENARKTAFSGARSVPIGTTAASPAILNRSVPVPTERTERTGGDRLQGIGLDPNFSPGGELSSYILEKFALPRMRPLAEEINGLNASPLAGAMRKAFHRLYTQRPELIEKYIGEVAAEAEKAAQLMNSKLTRPDPFDKSVKLQMRQVGVPGMDPRCMAREESVRPGERETARSGTIVPI